MKKLFAIFLTLGMLACLSACNEGPQPPQPSTQPQTATQQLSLPEKPLVRLYLPNDAADGFAFQQMWTDGSIEEIVSMLVAEGALPEGCAPLSFDKEGARLDMNEVFGQAVSRSGITGEYLLFGSLVNTVLVYYGLESLHITSGGEIIESGHAVYDEPLQFYENQEAAVG